RDALAALAAAVGQDLVDQAARAVGGGEDVLRVALERALRRLLGEHLAIADDAAQDVVEVVRDAAGEPADRLHLLRLAQPLPEARALLLRGFALGDVAEIDHHRADAGLVQQIGRRLLDPAPGAVLVPHAQLVGGRESRRLAQPGLPFFGERTIVRVHAFGHRLAAQFLEPVAHYPLDGG